MKRKTTKEILAESFRELAQKKPIDKITIKNITDNCGYSSATFYRHFQDKYDLIAWDYSNRVAQIMERVLNNGYTWRQTGLEGFNLFQEEKEYLINLLANTGGHDSFVRYMTETHFIELSAYLKKLTGLESFDKQTELCLCLYCLGTANLNCEWILGKIDATAEEMADVYEKSLPEPLRKLLPEE